MRIKAKRLTDISFYFCCYFSVSSLHCSNNLPWIGVLALLIVARQQKNWTYYVITIKPAMDYKVTHPFSNMNIILNRNYKESSTETAWSISKKGGLIVYFKEQLGIEIYLHICFLIFKCMYKYNCDRTKKAVSDHNVVKFKEST